MLSPPACPFVSHAVHMNVCRVAFTSIEYFELGPSSHRGLKRNRIAGMEREAWVGVVISACPWDFLYVTSEQTAQILFVISQFFAFHTL